jgi:hypothetical protein
MQPQCILWEAHPGAKGLMALENVQRIARMGSLFGGIKLLLALGTTTRPQLRGLLLWFLRPFTKDGNIALRYRCFDRYMTAYVRMTDLAADSLSVLELCVLNIYKLERGLLRGQTVLCQSLEAL